MMWLLRAPQARCQGLPDSREAITRMPCHLEDCESWMSVEALLIKACPSVRLRILPGRAQIHQSNASLVCILRLQCLVPLPQHLTRQCHVRNSHRLVIRATMHIRCVGQHGVQRGSAYIPVGATDGSRGAAAADGNVICFQLQVWKQPQKRGRPCALRTFLSILHSAGAIRHGGTCRELLPLDAAALYMCPWCEA